MKHKDYLEMLISPLANEGGGSEPTLIDKNISENGTYNASDDEADGYQKVVVAVPQPSGSVTLEKNTSPSGVDVAAKASAVVNVQGGADSDYAYPYVPTGYTEVHEVSLSKPEVQGYLAGQTDKQISVKLPLWMTLNNGDKIALTGYVQQTGEPFVIAGTVTGKTMNTNYFYPKLTIDYDGYVGDSPAIPSGYTEIKGGQGLTRNKVLSYRAGGTRTDSYRISATADFVAGDKICLTGVTYDTNEPYSIAGSVYSIETAGSGNRKSVTINPEYDGRVGLAVGMYVSANPGTDIDVKGRNFVKLAEDLIKPTGTKQIAANGTNIDVKQYEKVDVSVPGIVPTGTKQITANGTNIDVAQYEKVDVSVPGIVPSGSVTLTENTDSNGVDVTNKAAAVVAVQGGADAGYVAPYVPDGYTEVPTATLTKTAAEGYTAGQTNKTVLTMLPLSMVLNVGDKIALTGYTRDSGEQYVIAGTVSGSTKYSTYQYPILTIDYNGYVGDSPVIPSGYTEVVAGGVTKSTVTAKVAGATKVNLGYVGSLAIEAGDKICVTGLTSDTYEPYAMAGTVSSVTSSHQPKVTMDFDGMVGIGKQLYIDSNPGTPIDVKGRESVKLSDDLIKPTGTKPISANGTSIDVKNYLYVDVAVPTSSGGGNVTDFDGVIQIADRGLSASYSTPNTCIEKLSFPNLEQLGQENFSFFQHLTEIYFGINFRQISGMSFEGCTNLIAVYFDSNAGYLPTIYNGYPPGMSNQNCMYYMPSSMIQQAQSDANWSQLYQNGRIIDLNQAPWSEAVYYTYGQQCEYDGYIWEYHGPDGRTDEPGTDQYWATVQV